MSSNLLSNVQNLSGHSFSTVRLIKIQSKEIKQAAENQKITGDTIKLEPKVLKIVVAQDHSSTEPILTYDIICCSKIYLVGHNLGGCSVLIIKT